MTTKKLNELKKKLSPREIIYQHIANKITLTDKQLCQLILEKNK